MEIRIFLGNKIINSIISILKQVKRAVYEKFKVQIFKGKSLKFNL